jgi:hypothetical protein
MIEKGKHGRGRGATFSDFLHTTQQLDYERGRGT